MNLHPGLTSLIFILLFHSQSFANIVGTDLQNFNPNSNGLDFVTVQSSDTLEPGILNVGSFISFATNSLPFYKLSNAPNNQTFTEPNDKLLASDVHLALGIMKGWDVGASAAVILNQNIDDSSFLGTFERTGLADLRLNTKVRFHSSEDSGAALLASVDFERTDNNPFSGRDSGPTINLGLAYDTKISENWRWGLNAGYRFRSEGQAIATTGITPLKDQFIYSTALNYDMNKWDSHIMFEIFGSTPTEETPTPTDRKMSNLQGIVGWRWDVHKRFDVHFGAGTEIYHGLATPDILAYAGFNWRFGPLWSPTKDSDKDGVPDEDDRCPRTPKPERYDVNSWGCSDSDNDGVYNDLDQCPDSARGDEVDEKGCLIEVESVSDDFDGDGVINAQDECPNTQPNVEVNDFGCALQRVKNITLKNVNFYTGTARMTKRSKKRMNETISELIENKDTIEKVIVEGHTDSVGKRAMNQKLSQYRAETIRKYLIKHVGFSSNQVKAVGYGENKPVASNKTKSGRLKNRRVELRLIRTE